MMNKNTKETILLTGAGGYIGSVVIDYLLKKGYQVRALDTFYWGFRPLDSYLGRIEIIRSDIRNIKPAHIKNIKEVIHTAGLSNDPMADFNPKANFEINTKATVKFAKLCKKYKVNKFIFASSASIYDRSGTADILQDETTKVNPTAAYSLSKFKAEKEIKKLADNNFCPVIFRQGTVYGYSPRLRYDLVVNTMVKDALKNNVINVFCKGMQWRPLVDVRDVAQAYIVALESKNPLISGEIFNLLYKNYTILELSKKISKVIKDKFKMKIKINIDSSSRVGRNYKISSRKMKKFFSWEPQYSVENSVENLILKIKKNNQQDFDHPRYYNIEWMKLLLETQQILSSSKKIF